MNNHLETTIKVEVVEVNKQWTVKFNSGVQTFGTNYFVDDREDAEWYAETLRKFFNKQLITSHINYLKGEIEEINNLVISLGSSCEPETNILRDIRNRMYSQLHQAEQLLGNQKEL